MGGTKEMILIGIALVMTLIGLAYMIPKMSTKQLQQHIVKDLQMVSNIRDAAQTYSAVNKSGDYTGISVEALVDKNILPSSVEDPANPQNIKPPYDKKEIITVEDPNQGNTSLEGRSFKITLDVTNTKLDDTEKKIWEEKMKAALEETGGTVDNEGASDDGKLSVTYD